MENLPDVRDGLNHKQRIVLNCLNNLRKEIKKEYIPTTMLYGRVIEQIDISKDEFLSLLRGLQI